MKKGVQQSTPKHKEDQHQLRKVMAHIATACTSSVTFLQPCKLIRSSQNKSCAAAAGVILLQNHKQAQKIPPNGTIYMHVFQEHEMAVDLGSWWWCGGHLVF